MKKFFGAAVLAACAIPANASPLILIGQFDITYTIYDANPYVPPKVYKPGIVQYQFSGEPNGGLFDFQGNMPTVPSCSQCMTMTLSGDTLRLNLLNNFYFGYGSFSVFWKFDQDLLGDALNVKTANMVSGLLSNYSGHYGSSSFTGPATFLATPEPASWALMIAGFGLVGSSLRRRAWRLAHY